MQVEIEVKQPAQQSRSATIELARSINIYRNVTKSRSYIQDHHNNLSTVQPKTAPLLHVTEPPIRPHFFLHPELDLELEEEKIYGQAACTGNVMIKIICGSSSSSIRKVWAAAAAAAS